MQANPYQNWTSETATYPAVNTGTVPELMYLALGLAGEAAEVANKVKKLYRDGDSTELREGAKQELGDVLWYTARMAAALGITLEDVLQNNHDKLMSRKARGVIAGSGDNR
ncbi:MAG: nucleoside triphosphate pyrophosphohydrolase family protein [Alphaproteobacteria bacterium]